MDQPNTYSRITDQLDALSAPPGETIAERIKGLHVELTEAAARAVLEERAKGEAALADALRTVDAAWAALNAADLYVAEGTLATGIEGLASRRDAALEALGAVRHRADVAEYALESANESNSKLLREIDELRTQVARLSAQLDYATELCLAGFRQ